MKGAWRVKLGSYYIPVLKVRFACVGFDSPADVIFKVFKCVCFKCSSL